MPLMKKSVSRLIKPKRKNGMWLLYARGADGNLRWNIVRNISTRVPKKPYRVTYFLNPRGNIYILHPEIVLCKGPLKITFDNYSFACFLPKEWAGKRVSRKVEVIK